MTIYDLLHINDAFYNLLIMTLLLSKFIKKKIIILYIHYYIYKLLNKVKV